MKIVAYYDDGWFDHQVTDFRMWDHLCRAYDVDLEMVHHWKEVKSQTDKPIYIFIENGTIPLVEFDLDPEGIYVFGRTALDLASEVKSYKESIRIETPKEISLFGVVAAAIFIHEKVK